MYVLLHTLPPDNAKRIEPVWSDAMLSHKIGNVDPTEPARSGARQSERNPHYPVHARMRHPTTGRTRSERNMRRWARATPRHPTIGGRGSNRTRTVGTERQRPHPNEGPEAERTDPARSCPRETTHAKRQKEADAKLTEIGVVRSGWRRRAAPPYEGSHAE